MRSLLLSSPSYNAIARAAEAGGGAGGGAGAGAGAGGGPWFADKSFGLDVGGADKDIAEHLTATKAPDLKTALRGAIGAGKGPSGWDAVGWKPANGFFDLDAAGADKDIAEYVAGKHYPDLKAALRSGMSAEKLARDRKAMTLPEKGKEAEWTGWEALGWKANKAEYKVPAIDPAKVKLPPGMLYNQEMEDELVSFAHEQRIPLETATKARDFLVGQQIKAFDALKTNGAKSIEVTEDALRKDWGVDTDKNKELAKRAFTKFGLGVGDASALEKIAGAPGLIKLGYQIAQAIGEQNLPAAPGGGPNMPTTLAGLNAELNRLQADPEFRKSLRDARDPRHADTVAQRQRIINEIARLEGGS